MKAFSLYQPFATLAVYGFKRNFSYSRRMRKPIRKLAIHAATKPHPRAEEFCNRKTFRDALAQLGFDDPDDMPRGAIVGWVDILGNVERARITDSELKEYMKFADFEPAKWLWLMGNPIALRAPIQMRGRPAVFDVDDDILKLGSPFNPCGDPWLHEYREPSF